MINRSYFMAAKVNWLDGAQSYSWYYQQGDFKSLFSDSDLAFKEMKNIVDEFALSKGLPIEGIEITCFCRC